LKECRNSRLRSSLFAAVMSSLLLAAVFICPVSVLSAQTRDAAAFAALSDGMQFYFGSLHGHSLYSDGTGFPAQVFTWARDTAGFDFYVVTDHSQQLTQAEWDDTGVQTGIYSIDGSFVAMRGFEWSHATYGHINVFGTVDYTDTTASPDLGSIYGWIAARDALAQFNHPARKTAYFEGFAYDQAVSDNLCLYETGNGPTGNIDEAHYERYPVALDQGWRLAPTNNQDNHSLHAYSNRTVIISPQLSEDALLDALRKRRVYSSDDPDMRVIFKQGEHWMGSVVEDCKETVQFDVAVEDDENIASLELVTAGGVIAARKDFGFGEDSKKVVWSPSVGVQGNGYYFLRVVERDENGDDDTGSGFQVAVTAPIWLEVKGTNWYLAEGCTAGGFETWVLVQNPGDSPAQVTLTFMTENGPVPGPQATLPPATRLSFNAGQFVNSFHVSTKVDSDQPVVAERAVYWGNRTGGHDSIGVTAPAQLWYLAEGCTAGGFETWVLVQNPGDSPAQVTLTFMTENGPVAGPQATLPPATRLSFNAGQFVNSFHVSTQVESDRPIVAERAVYWGDRTEGHDSIGFPGD